jgi:enterobactin synthetase component D
VLSTPRGAPALPAGLIGSISHKQEIAVALAARSDDTRRRTIGVDVEIPRPLHNDISGRVLTPDEQVLLAELSGAARDREVLWRFAAKEAIYKALDPWVERLVSFQEVALDRRPGGRVSVRLNLTRGEGPFAVELEDASHDELVLIAARVAPA